jgi:uncharacterized membrane protein YkvI
MHLSTAPRSLMLMLLVAVVASSPACRAVEGIFKAGLWVGALIAIAAVAVIVFIANRLGS